MNWLALPAILAGCYYGIALGAALRRIVRRDRSAGGECPPVSILKPVCGRDPRFLEAIRTHAAQDYPNFEILFGSGDPNDPALEDVARLARENPALSIQIVPVREAAPNGKVATLIDLARQARHPVLLVNDSDICVEPDYLRRVVAPLADPGVGVVTCLYRAAGDSFAARFEALGIATEFAPSVLVARAVGVAEFALGSTMVFRRDRLEAIGGFEALREYLADDYQLGMRMTDQGYRVAFSDAVVETGLQAQSFSDAWRHQVRWSRTIRVSRPGGYFGYAVTQATVWAALAWTSGSPRIAAAVLGIRIAAGAACAAFVLNDRNALRLAPLIPFRDLWGFAVWIAGLRAGTVEWRGERLELAPDGRILGKSMTPRA